MNKNYTLVLLLLVNILSYGQFNPATNGYEKLENPASITVQQENYRNMSGLTGIPCDQNSFWAVSSGQIVSYALNGNTVTTNGNVMPAAGGSLAFCNNLDGGSFTPTFYTNITFTRAAYYNGTGWTNCNAPPKTWIVNGGGYGNFLYFTAHDSVTYNEIGITRYNGTSYDYVYKLSDTSRAITVADLAIDGAGNVWFFVGSHTTLHSDTLNVVSPSGQLLKQFPFQFNTDNAYGCIMLNGIIYIGLGGYNPDHPYTLIPVTINGSSAVAGTPITMPAAPYVDLASCTPGSPLTINEIPKVYELNIYPNPANKTLTITANKIISSIKIVNQQGQNVFQSSKIDQPTFNLDCSLFVVGIYFVEVSSDKGIFTQKFIVQH